MKIEYGMEIGNGIDLVFLTELIYLIFTKSWSLRLANWLTISSLHVCLYVLLTLSEHIPVSWASFRQIRVLTWRWGRPTLARTAADIYFFPINKSLSFASIFLRLPIDPLKIYGHNFSLVLQVNSFFTSFRSIGVAPLFR